MEENIKTLKFKKKYECQVCRKFLCILPSYGYTWEHTLEKNVIGVMCVENVLHCNMELYKYTWEHTQETNLTDVINVANILVNKSTLTRTH